MAALALAGLAGCSGGVSPSPNVVDPARITILPATAVLYSGLPTDFVISGGTGSYIVTSSNQAAIQISAAGVGSNLRVVPNPVLAETPVTLTVRDTGTTPQATATLTVRPGTVANNITVTPTGGTASSCTPAVCSGSDAEVSATISQGGIPLAARAVRFDVVNGNAYRFITTPPGVTPEILELSTSVVTDETGRARVRIRVQQLVPTQTALMQITDVGTGTFQRVSFAIAQFTGVGNPAFFTVPTSFTFIGPFVGQCATSGQADIAIFGGSPPYNIVNSFVGFAVTPAIVTTSGGRFTVSLTSSSACATNTPVSITDSSGRTITVLLNNVEGTATAPPTAVNLFPPNFALSCSFGATVVSASLTASGGSGTYSAGSTHPRVLVTVAGSTVTVQRLAGDGATTYPTSGIVSVTDGVSTDTSTFTVPANCP